MNKIKKIFKKFKVLFAAVGLFFTAGALTSCTYTQDIENEYVTLNTVLKEGDKLLEIHIDNNTIYRNTIYGFKIETKSKYFDEPKIQNVKVDGKTLEPGEEATFLINKSDFDVYSADEMKLISVIKDSSDFTQTYDLFLEVAAGTLVALLILGTLGNVGSYIALGIDGIGAVGALFILSFLVPFGVLSWVQSCFVLGIAVISAIESAILIARR